MLFLKKNRNYYIQLLLPIVIHFLVSCNQGPEPANFDISRIEGIYDARVNITPPGNVFEGKDYTGSFFVHLLTDLDFTLTFDFNDSISFPVMNGTIIDKINILDSGGAYFEIEVTDTLKGFEKGHWVDLRKGGKVKVYGTFSEWGINNQYIGMVLSLQNMEQDYTLFSINGDCLRSN